MQNRVYAILIAVAVVIVVLWNATFVVNEKEQAVVLRFGEIQRVIDQPGINFKLPFGFAGADTVRKLPDRLLRFDLDDIRVQVSGGKFYEVDAFLVYNIDDAATFVRTVSGSIPQAEQRLRTRLDAALRRVYGLRGFEAALSDERADMMRQVRDQIRPDASSLGIELDDVRIRRTDLTQEVSQQTYERMQAERLAEAERLRARGQVAARQIRAAADREVVETKASARRDAEVLQGEGDAQRNAVFADAFGKNPEFFDFYRSMQAYRQALENSGTTMVLSPDTEFFDYFGNQEGTGGLSLTPANGQNSAASGASGSGASNSSGQSAPAQSDDGTASLGTQSQDNAGSAGATSGAAIPGLASPQNPASAGSASSQGGSQGSGGSQQSSGSQSEDQTATGFQPNNQASGGSAGAQAAADQ